MNQSVQSPKSIIMVRPHHYHPNPMSADDNGFQQVVNPDQYNMIARAAYDEVSKASEILRNLGITVHIFEDESHDTPDSVFPNNWLSTHSDASVALYPMYVPNRRKERRSDIIDMLKHSYHVNKVHDYSSLENDNIYLEGTGAMVLDHDNRIAYAARSNRADKAAFDRFCADFSYRPFMFDAHDKDGTAVYHTNVMMCIGRDYALVGLDMLRNEDERAKLRQMLERSGKEIIDLSEDQIFQFSGNAIELSSIDGFNLIMSKTSFASLSNDQITSIERYAKITAIDVKTIEMAGGSIRCMIAGVHLDPKK